MPASENRGTEVVQVADVTNAHDSNAQILSLSGPAFCVVDGTAIVFRQGVAADGRPGRRHFLLERNKGDLVFPLGSADAPLLLKGVQSEVRQIDPHRLFTGDSVEFSQTDLCGAVDSWVIAASDCLPITMAPVHTVDLLHPPECSLKEGVAASVEKGVVWVAVTSGACHLFGRQDLPVWQSTYYPITVGSWLQANENSELTVRTTLELAQQNKLQESVQAFNGLVTKLLELHPQEGVSEEVLRSRQEAEQINLRLAVDEMVGILASSTKLVSKPMPGNALYNATRLVGQAAGISMQLPSLQSLSSDEQEQLCQIAAASRCRMRTVRFDDQWWRSDCGPLLGFMGEEEAPRALIPQRSGGYVSIDPSAGTNAAIDESIAKELGSTAISFYRSLPDEKAAARDVWRFVLYGLRGDVLCGLGAALWVGILSLVLPIATGVILTVVVPTANYHRLYEGVLILISVTWCASALNFVRLMYLARIEQKASTSLEAAMWDRLLRLPVPFFRQFTSGDLIDRTMTMDRLRDLVAKIAESCSGLMSIALFNLILMLQLNWTVSVLMLSVLASGFILLVVAAKARAKIEHKLLGQEGHFIALSLEVIGNIAKLRVAGADNRALSRWYQAAAAKARLSFSTQSIDSRISAANSVIPLVSAVVLFAGVAFATADMPLRDFLIYNVALGQFLASTLGLVGLIPEAQLLSPLYDRVRPLFEAVPETEQSGINPGKIKGEIEFSGVSAAYDIDVPPVLSNVSFKVRAGEFVAFVGRSGSGKSTIVKLILGFEKALSGNIFFDGKSLDELDIRQVRRQMGVVLQNDKLIPGSIFLNIAGNSGATMEDAWEAARMAGIAKDIEAMPLGMETMVIEGAGTISGGQKQRLLVARAVIRKPRILVFDEATSALDNKTQATVIASLQRLKSTRIVVAQRLSTVQNADRIFVVDQGQIVESGTFQELMSRPGAFMDLAQRQLA